MEPGGERGRGGVGKNVVDFDVKGQAYIRNHLGMYIFNSLRRGHADATPTSNNNNNEEL